MGRGNKYKDATREKNEKRPHLERGPAVRHRLRKVQEKRRTLRIITHLDANGERARKCWKTLTALPQQRTPPSAGDAFTSTSYYLQIEMHRTTKPG